MNFFIIDCMGLVFRSHYSHATLIRNDGVLSGSVYGFVVGISSLKKKYDKCQFVFAWDCGSTRKKGIYEGYKSNRNSMNLDIQVDDLKNLLKGLNVIQVEKEGEEADDVIASYVEKTDGMMYVYSSDKDMLQLVRDGKVVVIRPKPGLGESIYDEEAVKEEYGVSSGNFAFYQALRGDAIDSVPGVPRVPTSLIKKLTSKYSNIVSFYDGINNEPMTEFQKESFLKFSESLKINIRLTSLTKDLDYSIHAGSSNVEIVKKYLDLYDIKKVSPEALVNLFEKTSEFNHRESIALKTYSVF